MGAARALRATIWPLRHPAGRAGQRQANGAVLEFDDLIGDRRVLVVTTNSADAVVAVRHDQRNPPRHVPAKKQNGSQRLALAHSLEVLFDTRLILRQQRQATGTQQILSRTFSDRGCAQRFRPGPQNIGTF
jgi:hypothetical protein